MPENSEITPALSLEKSTQAALLELRNQALRARFHQLYHKKRIRTDDVIKQLETEFFITERTIRAVLKTDPPA